MVALGCYSAPSIWHGDCQNLTRIYHFRQSEDIDDYVQESGRGGQGGEPCHAVLTKYLGLRKQTTGGNMKEYLENDSVCRHVKLMQPISVQDVPHLCRDICARKRKYCPNESYVDP